MIQSTLNLSNHRDKQTLRRSVLVIAAGTALAMLTTAATVAARDQTSAPQTVMGGMMPATMPAMAPATQPAMTQAMSPATQPAMAQDSAPATQPSAALATHSFITAGLGKDGAIKLFAGHSDVITTRAAIKRVSISNPDVADVTLVAPNTVLLTSKKAGSTQLIVWDEQEHSTVIEVYVDLDLSEATMQLKQAFPNLKLELSALNDSIAVRGMVPSAQIAEQVMEMASTFGKTHNFLEVGGGQQVMLQVRFAEVSKSAIRDLGVTYGGTDGVSSFSTNSFSSATNTFLPDATTGLLKGTSMFNGGISMFGSGRFGSTAFDYFLNALADNGLVRVLAEPNIVAISGQEASMLAGGQIPIPVPQAGAGGGTIITIEYHPYGVRLTFLPQVLGNGKVRLKVMPEVSDLDYTNAVSINGTTVPAFTDRKVQTTVELADGQSFALAGLLNSKTTASKSAVPILGQLPIIGALFRSVAWQRNETELVVLVTPRLVHPMNPDQVPALPGEHWREPSDPSLFSYGDLGGPVGSSAAPGQGEMRSGPPPQYQGVYGFTAAGGGSAEPAK